jgi:hypothetical protein
MWVVLALVLAAGAWWLAARWRRGRSSDPRLTLGFWRNSGLVLALYLFSILVGAGITRIMVGFNRAPEADVLMVGFFLVWVLYGAVWLLRYLPRTDRLPGWLVRSRFWIDAAALATLAALAAGARML